ncbi:LPXTG cell wall anchor domain-containing protein [Micromonospora avicenniae]|uniref:LPXTG cell wall anchor domain-containing protein n=1 Tax=Micromonospora avicenniae TaxID=1198245 RepID=UPI0033348E4C
MAVVLVAAVAAALAPINSDFYHVWIYNDPQTNEELHEEVMIDMFMAHTSGFFWGQIIALILGAFLAARVRGMPRALGSAVCAGLLLAAVDFAVAWQSSAGIRQRIAWWTENHPGFLPTDPLSDGGFHHVLAVGLASFPVAAIAGVGLGTLITPLLRLPAVVVAILAVLAAVPYGAFAAVSGWFAAAADGEPMALFVLLALLPPAAVTPSAVRTAIGDHGDAFTNTMLVSGVGWALLLLIAGLLARRRRSRSGR